MKRFLLLFVACAFATLTGFSQSRVALCVKFSTRPMFMPLSAKYNGSEIDAKKLPGLFGCFKETKNGQETTWFGYGNFGLEMRYCRPFSHLGFNLSCRYQRFGFRIKDLSNVNYGDYVIGSFEPEFDIKYTFGGVDKIFRPIIQLGGTYVLPVSYKSPNVNNKIAVNKGLELVAGIGFEMIPGFAGTLWERRYDDDRNATFYLTSPNENLYYSVLLEYRYKFYNVFNEGYSEDALKTKIGFLCFTISRGLF